MTGKWQPAADIAARGKLWADQRGVWHALCSRNLIMKLTPAVSAPVAAGRARRRKVKFCCFKNAKIEEGREEDWNRRGFNHEAHEGNEGGGRFLAAQFLQFYINIRAAELSLGNYAKSSPARFVFQFLKRFKIPDNLNAAVEIAWQIAST